MGKILTRIKKNIKKDIPPNWDRYFCRKQKKNVLGTYLRKISIHETLISRSICLLWAKITSDTHSSIRNPPSATDPRAPDPPSAGWVADADVCVAGDLAQRRHMLLEMRVSWMLIHKKKKWSGWSDWSGWSSILT